MLGEVLDVFPSSSFRLRSFVDCTLGAAGHSCAIIQAHPELQTYIGLDVDPMAHEKAQSRIGDMLKSIPSCSNVNMKPHILLRNFKEIKQVIGQVEEKLLLSGVDGILMDLGMSSMQVPYFHSIGAAWIGYLGSFKVNEVDDPGRGFSMLNNGPLDMRMDPKGVDNALVENLIFSFLFLFDVCFTCHGQWQGILKAEDILNSWPPAEVGRILREYGEESNWYSLQIKIAKARLGGGFHSTSDLVDLIRGKSAGVKGGRQGWIKTAARVFQALRIAVNDELKTLENSLYSCFDCLSPGGRLAVISFHSLEDRIVKQTFLNIINNNIQITAEEEGGHGVEPRKFDDEPTTEKEAWIKQVVKGPSGIILTKRPITASAEEEKLNSRCRSAKLRVIQKL
ncbi:Ribosomal RNA small subunit methyltransferase H [Bienertia sinuspersici]